MKNIVILISGRGSNMQALIQACEREGWNARICAVISNKESAGGLAVARAHGIPTKVVPHADYTSRAQFDQALAQVIEQFQPDIVAMAGFMRILSREFVDQYAGKLVNIHPSLLPSFPGLATHNQALACGVQVHGATVHFVTADLDHGPIIIQGAVPVLASDNEEKLAARVLEIEHRIYSAAIRWMTEDRVRLEGSHVRVLGQPQRLVFEVA